MQDTALLDIRNLKMYFPMTTGIVFQRTTAEVKAVDDVSFFIRPGETLGLVGESGCGKTTTGRCILQLYRPTAGEILFENQDLCKMAGGSLRAIRRRMQMIFQDPYASLNPRMNAGNIIGEPLIIHKMVSNRQDYREKVANLLEVVGLNPSMADRFPHEFSGGQRQRIAIARALVLHPEFIICDEPVSALDVSIQAQILNLLLKLQNKLRLTYLFIAHDLTAVAYASDRVAVMYLGQLVEIAATEKLYYTPKHPYTEALMSAIPPANPNEVMEPVFLEGERPSQVTPPSGCRFHTRCRYATHQCKSSMPTLQEFDQDHYVACHLAKELHLKGAQEYLKVK